jgi:hypothetical protein
MIDGLGAVCDDFYVTCRLFLKLDMAPTRETVLHFFDRMRREFPTMKKLRMRDADSIVLEEEGVDGQSARRWIRVDPGGLRFGFFAPPSLDAVRQLAATVLEQAPFHLTFSDLDYDHLEVIYGFDLAYRGNHDQLVAETLFNEQTAAAFLFGDHAAHAIDAQPYFGVALTPECDVQAYVEVKSRTTTFEVRSGSFENEPITVFLTLRKYWGEERVDALSQVTQGLFDLADELATDRVVPGFVNPLAAAIASRP